MGVETGGGVFTALIPRNTTIPTEQERDLHDERRQPVVRARPRPAGRAQDGRRQPEPRPLRADGHPAGAARRAQDPGHVPHRRRRHRQRRGQGPRDGARRRRSRSRRRAGCRRKRSTARERGRAFKLADEVRRELAEVRNQAETLLYTTDAGARGVRGPRRRGDRSRTRGRWRTSCARGSRSRRTRRRSGTRTRSSRR